MKFKKYESNGNDFIVLITTSNINKKNISRLCDRHYGIGADGVLVLKKLKNQSFSLSIFNADGSEASMCGNGLKIIGKCLKEEYSSIPFFWVKIKNQSFQIFVKDNYVKVYIPLAKKVNDEGYPIYEIGNTHMLVETIEEDKQLLLAELYPEVNVSSYVLKKSNIYNVFLRTYEVGVGFTKSCGSASICLYSLLIDQGYKGDVLHVLTAGGEFDLMRKGNRLVLTGYPKMLFIGEFNDEIFN